MPRVLLLATTTGYQTRAFDEAAARLGVELTLATDRCNVLDDPWRDRAIAIRFHDEPASTDTLVSAAAERSFDGILVVGDRPTAIAARVADRLRLKGHPLEGAVAARHKALTRERLREAGLLVPDFFTVPVSGDIRAVARRAVYPAVVKPAALSASRGVIRVDTAVECVAAFERLRAILRQPDILSERNDDHETALVETFVEGREFAVEGLLTDGELEVLAIFDKPDPLDGPFFEETLYVTPSREPPAVQTAIVETIAAAAAAIGLWHGPIHAECRVNDRGGFVREVAARPIGGLCARTLRFVRRGPSGTPPGLVEFEELLLRHALGEPIRSFERESAAAGVMMMPIARRGVLKRVKGIDAARAVAGIEDVRITAKQDQVLVPLPEGSSYLGFLFARAPTPQQVERALRDAHAGLEVVLEPEVRVLQSRHG